MVRAYPVDAVTNRTIVLTYWSTDKGHFCGPTRFGMYKMPATWIDTDNEVWEEPYHLYTAGGTFK